MKKLSPRIDFIAVITATATLNVIIHGLLYAWSGNNLDRLGTTGMITTILPVGIPFLLAYPAYRYMKTSTGSTRSEIRTTMAITVGLLVSTAIELTILGPLMIQRPFDWGLALLSIFISALFYFIIVMVAVSLARIAYQKRRSIIVD